MAGSVPYSIYKYTVMQACVELCQPRPVPRIAVPIDLGYFRHCSFGWFHLYVRWLNRRPFGPPSRLGSCSQLVVTTNRRGHESSALPGHALRISPCLAGPALGNLPRW